MCPALWELGRQLIFPVLHYLPKRSLLQVHFVESGINLSIHHPHRLPTSIYSIPILSFPACFLPFLPSSFSSWLSKSYSQDLFNIVNLDSETESNSRKSFLPFPLAMDGCQTEEVLQFGTSQGASEAWPPSSQTERRRAGWCLPSPNTFKFLKDKNEKGTLMWEKEPGMWVWNSNISEFWEWEKMERN